MQLSRQIAVRKDSGKARLVLISRRVVSAQQTEEGNLGCLHPVARVRSGDVGFYPSTH
jgi:hypothetical protein